MTRARLLIAYAHPDDESFGLGALIARYVERGVEVGLICATNGDCGTVDPALLNGYQSIAELRLAELDRAAAVLGLHQVYKLGYKDSGMMGSATAQDPACLWQASQAEVVRRVTAILREFKPQVVITFNRYGGYGHPDHIAIQRATTEAFYRAGDPDYLIEGLPPYAPQKLYYSGIPASMLRWRIMMARLQGRDPRRLGRNHDVDLAAILDHLEPIHARVDIRDYHRQWDAASACHASQLGSTRMPGLPLWLRRHLFTHQGFTRIHPPPSADRVDERDLFDGVTFPTPDAAPVP